jgi:N,N'-diacetyllegionaminate synthase
MKTEIETRAVNHFKSNKNPVLYIAEIGGNHEGDFEYARRLANLAIRSGADAVKFQIYTGDSLVSPEESPNRNAHFKKFELPQEQYLELADRCNHEDHFFMASVWSKSMLEVYDRHIPIHKVGSGDLTCFPLIKWLVGTKKPLILSTGLATMDEVQNTVSYIASLDEEYLNQKKLALLHCTSSYPTPDEDANLDVIPLLKKEFGLPIGYSDHTLGTEAVKAAVALGAEIIEKHFTDTREGQTFRDHLVSLTCEEVRQLIPKLERINKMKGNSEKKLTESEKKDDHQISFRRSVYANRTIRKGEIFSETNLTVLRPAHGISANRFDQLLGKKSSRSIQPFQVLQEEDLD